jgi:phytoene/squalene synthetase
MVRPKSRPALWAMISIYYGILRRIRKLGYDVYAQRAGLTALEKTWIVLRAFQLRLLGGPLPYPAS